MAAEDVANLRAAVMRYKAVDDQLRDLNKQVNPLREQRKLIEAEMIDILRQPAYAAYTKLDIREDGSSIRIKKPDTWSAPWSLSKSKLLDYLRVHFRDTPQKATELYEYILNGQRESLRQNTFSIERVVP